MTKLKVKYHVLMAKWYHGNAMFLSRMLGTKRHNSKAWQRAHEKTIKHLMKVM